MAKLSARGRTVIHAVTREYDADYLQRQHDKRYPDKLGEKSLCMWERKTRRLMSDGSVLGKIDVRFQPDWLDKSGRYHSYGWKLEGKLKPGITPAKPQSPIIIETDDGATRYVLAVMRP